MSDSSANAASTSSMASKHCCGLISGKENQPKPGEKDLLHTWLRSSESSFSTSVFLKHFRRPLDISQPKSQDYPRESANRALVMVLESRQFLRLRNAFQKSVFEASTNWSRLKP